MKAVTSFSDKFLIKAAIDYSYRISRYDIHNDPILKTTEIILEDFNQRYKAVLIENKPIIRLDKNNQEETIQLRYMIIEDSYANPVEHALIFQGSDTNYESVFSGEDTDWSNNLSSAVHLPIENYKLSKNEYQYLNSLNKYNITATSGNSLGGGYALSLAEINDSLRIIAVNPAPPQLENKFKDSDFSTLINTSTDFLTRMLKTDISRYKQDDYDKIKKTLSKSGLSSKDKTKEFDQLIQDLDYQISYYYGVKTYPVARSLYFNEAMYIEAAHRGTILEPRDVAIDIFKNNRIPYSTNFAAKIFTQTKELIDYSRYFIKFSTNQISNEGYRDLVDNYITKAFKPIHQDKLQDYKDFNSLASFLQYDIKTKNLIKSNGQLMIESSNFDINDFDYFIESLKLSIKDYKKSIDYPINRVVHDINEEEYMSSKESNLNQIMTFFASSFNVRINFDLDVLEVFKGLPLTILFNIAELLDQNRRYFKGLKSDLLKYFSANNTKLTNPDIIGDYRNIYRQSNKTIEVNKNIIMGNLEVLTNNLQLVLNEDISLALGYRYFQGKKVVEKFKDFETLEINFSLRNDLFRNSDENLIVAQYDQVLTIIDNYRINTVEELSENIKKSEEIVKSSIQFIDKKTLKKEDYHLSKLSEQMKAMLENIDLSTIYYNSLNVFRYDIAALALSNTVGQSIITHYHQLIETNQQLFKMLENLKLYINKNTSSIVQDRLLNDVDLIKADIQSLNTFIDSFVH